MDYRARSNAVRAEARAKLIELRKERLAKRGIKPNVVASTVDTIESRKSVRAADAQFDSSPEILAALGLSDTSSEDKPAPRKKPKTPRKKSAPKKAASAKKRKDPSSKTSTKSAAKNKAKTADVAPSSAAADSVESAVTAQTDEAVAVVDHPEPISTQETDMPAPAGTQTVSRPRTALDVARSTKVSRPRSLSSLKPVSDQLNPYSLERLPSVGPGLIWHLQKAGVYSLDDLAHADVDTLVEKLGSITRLMRLNDWISMAKKVNEKTADIA